MKILKPKKIKIAEDDIKSLLLENPNYIADGEVQYLDQEVELADKDGRIDMLFSSSDKKNIYLTELKTKASFKSVGVISFYYSSVMKDINAFISKYNLPKDINIEVVLIQEDFPSWFMTCLNSISFPLILIQYATYEINNGEVAVLFRKIKSYKNMISNITTTTTTESNTCEILLPAKKFHNNLDLDYISNSTVWSYINQEAIKDLGIEFMTSLINQIPTLVVQETSWGFVIKHPSKKNKTIITVTPLKNAIKCEYYKSDTNTWSKEYLEKNKIPEIISSIINYLSRLEVETNVA